MVTARPRSLPCSTAPSAPPWSPSPATARYPFGSFGLRITTERQYSGPEIRSSARSGSMPSRQLAPRHRRRDDHRGDALLPVPQGLLDGVGDLRVAGGLDQQVGDDLRGHRVAQGARRPARTAAARRPYSEPVSGAGSPCTATAETRSRTRCSLELPAPVDGGLADARPPRDALDGHPREADGGQFLEDGAADRVRHVLPQHGGSGGAGRAVRRGRARRRSSSSDRSIDASRRNGCVPTYESSYSPRYDDTVPSRRKSLTESRKEPRNRRDAPNRAPPVRQRPSP